MGQDTMSWSHTLKYLKDMLQARFNQELSGIADPDQAG